MKSTRVLAASIAALALVAAACGGSGSSAAPGGGSGAPAGVKTLKVGFTASNTGTQQLPSQKQVEGIELWAEDVTKAGGIRLKDGTVLMPELVSYDDESKADRVQSLYTKLINDDGVDVLLSPYSSGLVKAAAVVSEQNDTVMVTAGGADDATMEQGFTSVYQVYTPASKYLTGAIDLMLAPYRDVRIDLVVGMESRGFIFSAPMAYALGVGLVPVRKLGKLPHETLSVEYALEYGSNTLEIHRDAITPGQRVLIVDDLLATGGTVRGTVDLVSRLGAEIVGLSFLIELLFLKGRERLESFAVSSVIQY